MRVPGVLAARDFRRFWAGETVSLFGDQITLIALPLVAVLELHASAAQMGFLVQPRWRRTSCSRCTRVRGSTAAAAGARR